MKQIFLCSALCSALASCLLLPGCCEPSKPAVPKEKMKGLVVINVLDKDMHDDCRIKGSINIPLEELERAKAEIDPSAEIVVYCSNYMCTASDYARKQLLEMGFANVHAYEAGIAGWYQAKKPVEGPCKEAYLGMQVAPPEKPAVGEISTQELAEKMAIATE